jgi:phosphomannomutase
LLNKETIKFNNNVFDDLIKFHFQDNSWIAVRASGTEPKIKIYFSTNASTEVNAQRKIKILFEYLTNLIDQATKWIKIKLEIVRP